MLPLFWGLGFVDLCPSGENNLCCCTALAPLLPWMLCVRTSLPWTSHVHSQNQCFLTRYMFWKPLMFYSIMLTYHNISSNSLKHLDTTLIVMWQMMWNGSGIFPFYSLYLSSFQTNKIPYHGRCSQSFLALIITFSPGVF